MDAAVLNDPTNSKNGPLIALLFNQNKVVVLKEDDFSLVNNIAVSDWTDNSVSERDGFITLLPHSDFLVVAKEGESKVIFKNYVNLGKNDRVLETAFSNINNIFLSPDHKIITVFDRGITALL